MKTTAASSIFIILSLVCIGLLPNALAVVPPPDGGYLGGNTAEGSDALLNLTSGVWNTGSGYQALNHDTTGHQNTATGYQSSFSNTVGEQNTATGALSLFSNLEGGLNTAIGYRSLFRNTVGLQNTASGALSLFNNLGGASNMANGYAALYSNTTGSGNTGLGEAAGYFITTGSNNTALGHFAGFNVRTANNVICIGANVYGANVSNSCYIGQIFGATSPGGTAVFIDSNGKLGTVTSSKRFKEDIKSMDEASEALFSLKPVTFRYKKEIDVQRIPQFGLVAEEVEKVNPDLVVRDTEGNPYSVRYDQVNAMLLNEFLKEHRKNEEQQKQINVLTAQLKEQASQIQKVSAQLATASPSRGGLEATKFAIGRIRRGGTAPQVVNNP
jgi:hypothetical protein